MREAAVQDRLARHPRGTIPARAKADRATLLQTFTDMLKSQGAEVTRVTGKDAVKAIARDSPPTASPSLCVWAGTNASQLCPGRSEPASRSRHSRRQSIVVSGRGRGRRDRNPVPRLRPRQSNHLAFLPETHFILVEEADIVGCYEEAFDRLRALYGEGNLPRSVNMISGPSRTADIEQTIVRGAHGPKRLHVLILA